MAKVKKQGRDDHMKQLSIHPLQGSFPKYTYHKQLMSAVTEQPVQPLKDED